MSKPLSPEPPLYHTAFALHGVDSVLEAVDVSIGDDCLAYVECNRLPCIWHAKRKGKPSGEVRIAHGDAAAISLPWRASQPRLPDMASCGRWRGLLLTLAEVATLLDWFGKVERDNDTARGAEWVAVLEDGEGDDLTVAFDPKQPATWANRLFACWDAGEKTLPTLQRVVAEIEGRRGLECVKAAVRERYRERRGRKSKR